MTSTASDPMSQLSKSLWLRMTRPLLLPPPPSAIQSRRWLPMSCRGGGQIGSTRAGWAA